MIHTHKPRGHIWTHSSAFQQTEEYRDIRFEECTADPDRPLVRDEDQNLSRAERTAKRRRIEKLADDFLNGVPLFISSATPCPQALQSTIVWNKKSSNEPKFVLPRIDRSEDPPEGSVVWEDVESDAEILQRLSRQHQPSDQQELCDVTHMADSRDSCEVIEAEEAQASCGRVRRLKPIQITAGPSEDALKQAAVLRARRFQRAKSELPIMPNGLSVSAEATNTGAEPRSEPSYESQKQREERRTFQWLSRRKSSLPFAGQNADDSIDELQLPGIDTPSQRSKHAQITSKKPSDGIPDVEQESISVEAETRNESSGDILHRVYHWDEGRQNSSHEASHHTVSGNLEVEAAPGHSSDRVRGQDDSAKQFFTPEGQTMRLPTRRSGRALSEIITPVNVEKRSRKDGLRDIGDHILDLNVSTSPDPEGVPKEENQKPGNAPKGRRSNSSGGDISQRSSAPASNRQTRSKSAYIAAQASQNGTTPLLYRKGRLSSHEKAAAQPEQEKKQKSATIGSLDETRTTTDETVIEVPPPPSAEPPLLDMSFKHDSSFAPNLNMALVDEHLNSILHSTPNSGRRSSSIKKALRQEMRNSGAEITRCDSEPPPSSQLDQSSSNVEGHPADDSEPVESFQEKWAGTQFLLKQAQKDLIPSPEKQGTNDDSVNEATPRYEEDTPVERSVSRGPLKQLSQEPMPSTQQLLGDFEGWSTVKKPRAVQTYSPLLTPTATGKCRQTSSHLMRRPLSSSGLDTATEGASRGKSSLRFLIAVTSSPIGTDLHHEQAHIQSSPSKMEEAHTSTPAQSPASTGSRQKSMLDFLDSPKQFPSTKSMEQNSALESCTLRPLSSSFPAAQPQSELLRDSSNLSETIDELTRDVLGLEDLEGVLSQVH